MPLRIGVLGAARIAPFALYAPVRVLGAAEVVVSAIAARDRARAAKVAKKAKIARVHDSYDALLHDPDIDAVYVPLPNALHHAWTIKALDAGKHVLCEKPLASNAREAAEMGAAAQRNGKVLMEAFHWRFHPMARHMVEVVRAGQLGKLRRVETSMCIPLPMPGDIRWQYELGGGALMDVGAYAVHMMRHLSLREPVVTAVDVKLASPKVDRFASADVDLGDGAVGKLTCSLWSKKLLDVSAVVVGEHGEMRAFNPVAPQLPHHLTTVIGGRKTVDHFDKVASYTTQLRAFVQAVREGKAELCGPDDSVANMKVIDAIYEKAGLPLRGGV